MSSPSDSVASPVDSLLSYFTSAASTLSTATSLASSADVAVPRTSSCSSFTSSSATDDSLTRRIVASVTFPPRKPELQHLAVILARELWKPDREEHKCNTFHCRKSFTLFERKHHCRRCGGVFCHDCSAQVTPLLDTSKLPFVYPPNNIPVECYATPQNPMKPCRVCDDCYEELHGTIPQRQIELRQKSCVSYSLPRPKMTRHHTTDGTCSNTGSKTRSRHRGSVTSSPPRIASPVPPTTPTSDPDPFAGYPLRVPSAICKANGGGRWVPTPQPKRWDSRPFGDKTHYEIKMEKDEERRRRKRENPIIVDGEFAVRKCIVAPPRPKRQNHVCQSC